MALTTPLSLLQFPGQIFDSDGNPLAGGFLQFYDAGTTTPSTIWADVNANATLTNPVQLDSAGYAQVFLGPQLYDVVVSNSLSVQLYTVSGVGNPGQIVYAGLGNTLATGSQNVDSGYSVLSTDQLVTVSNVSNTDPWIVNLPAASTRSTLNAGNGLPLTIKNLSAKQGHIVAAGADTIDINATFTVPVAADPTYPSVVLVSDGESAWWVLASHGL